MPGILSRPRRERIPPLELGGGNGAPLDVRDSRPSSGVETSMSGNFLSCSKGVKDPFEEQEGRCDFPRDAAVIKGVHSHGGDNLLVFLELLQVLFEL